GLELGADDYICKPFSPREVVARVRAVLRRTAQAASNAPASALALDEDQWSATLHGEPLNLTRREFRLLQALARHPGRI
ncbi:DNA-binding response regulator, partial [Stenotrophomonas maltophilia]